MMFLVDDQELPYNEVHITYKIKKGDTLQSVANELHINSRVLRAYHNIHCRIPDLIETDFPYQLEYLILAPEKIELSDEDKEKKRQKVVFNDGNLKLSLNYAQIDTTYNALYKIENGDQLHTIKQDFNVKWKTKTQNGYYYFEVNRTGKMYINDEVPNSMAEEIAEKASAALYPLLVVVDETGKWVYINNFDEIKQRWAKVKKEINTYYKGEFVDNYFAIYDKNLENGDTLYFSLSKDWFLNAFFSGIHVQYPVTLSLQEEVEFPFMAKNENINYLVDIKIDDYLDVDNFLVVEATGKLYDERTKTDFENALKLPVKEYTEEKATGGYRAKYFLNPNNYLPETLLISCDLALDSLQRYSVTICNLNDKSEQVIATRQELFMGEVKPQKKWWQL
ncbi:MAG: LysM domain-containing protein [Flavobacterium sp.]